MAVVRNRVLAFLAAGALAAGALPAAAANEPGGAAVAQAEPHRWSADVTRRSSALDLEPGVFTSKDPKSIALSLKRSAENSRRRKSDPYRSAMSMLNFYINRAGRNLPADRKQVLEQAKVELRKAFGRDAD